MKYLIIFLLTVFSCIGGLLIYKSYEKEKTGYSQDFKKDILYSPIYTDDCFNSNILKKDTTIIIFDSIRKKVIVISCYNNRSRVIIKRY